MEITFATPLIKQQIDCGMRIVDGVRFNVRNEYCMVNLFHYLSNVPTADSTDLDKKLFENMKNICVHCNKFLAEGKGQGVYCVECKRGDLTTRYDNPKCVQRCAKTDCDIHKGYFEGKLR